MHGAQQFPNGFGDDVGLMFVGSPNGAHAPSTEPSAADREASEVRATPPATELVHYSPYELWPEAKPRQIVRLGRRGFHLSEARPVEAETVVEEDAINGLVIPSVITGLFLIAASLAFGLPI